MRGPGGNGGDRPAGREKEYFAAIETRFQQRRGHPLLLSPRDWLRISDWWARGIPRGLVLEGIDLAFRRGDGRPAAPKVRSLGYCEPIILDLWERRRHHAVGRRAAHSGAADGRRAAGLRRHLDRVREALRRADRPDHPGSLRRALRRCLEQLERDPAFGPGRRGREADLEERLQRMERELAEAIGESLPMAERARIEAGVERDLRPYRDMMSATTYAETRRVLFEDRLRRRCDLPRLSLFDLP